MSSQGPSDELSTVIGEALTHAVEMLNDDDLLPFVYARGGVAELDPSGGPELAAAVIEDLPHFERCWVLVAPEPEPQTGPGPCLHVRAGERGNPDAYMFEQHFRERGFLRGAALVGDLAFIGECENPIG